MAQPIKRDEFEAIEEAGYSALAMPIKAALVVAAIGAAVAMTWNLSAAMTAYSAAAGAVGQTQIGAFIGTMASSAAWGGAIAGIGAIAVGVISAPLTAGLALFGLMKGSHKVSKENAAYAAKMKEQSTGREAEMIAVHNQALQQGFQAGSEQAFQAGTEQGRQEGAQMVLAKLREHAEQENAGSDKSFAATETQRREQAVAAAAAGTQIG